MINLSINEDGKPYKKIKNRHGNVLGYEFVWTISTHPRVANATEVKEINQNPQELKIAKDLIKGKKPKKTSGNNFNDFKQNDITDWDAYEDAIRDN